MGDIIQISRNVDMKFNIAIVFGCLFAFVCSASAQTKTVTNKDLEKFKTKRIAAEKELRENYAQLGFPSPEELEKQNVQSAKERFALFEKLQAERLERERIEAERQRIIYESNLRNQPYVIVEREDSNGYLVGYSIRGNRREPWRSHQPFRGNSIGWRATGGGVIYEPGGSSYIRTPILMPQRPVATWLPRP